MGNIWQYNTVPSQGERLPWTWTWHIMYFYCWSHFEKRPGSCLVYYVQSFTNTTRGLFVMECCYTFIVATVSYRYCSYLYLCAIQMCRYICCYYLLNYDNYVSLIYFILNCHGTLIFSQILNQFFCGIMNKTFSHYTMKSIIFDFQSSTTSAETKILSPKPHDH